MSLRKNILLTTIIFNIISTTSAQENNIQYTFAQTDSSYTFSGSFKIKASTGCLLDICFQHKHIKALAPDAKKVVLTNEGTDWNKISYTYQKFIYFENTTLWFRTLDKEKLRVNFTLISSENNKNIMPRLISSSGYYQLNKKGEETIVKYYQECQLSRSSITKIYLNKAKKDAIRFINWFYEYANMICTE